MMLQVLLLHTILLSCHSSYAKSLVSNFTKPGCQPSCGNVSIPFPFGIGADCYMDKTFEIDCTSSKKPVLKKFNLEVLDISVNDGTMHVLHPIQKYCQGDGDPKTLILKGAPFFYCQNRNKFTVVGCNRGAFLINENHHSEEINLHNIRSGCISLCGDQGYNISNPIEEIKEQCVGLTCCQADMSQLVQSFTTVYVATKPTTNSIEDEKAYCSYAFLVDSHWTSHARVFQNTTYVPVALDWGIYNNLSSDQHYRETQDQSFNSTVIGVTSNDSHTGKKIFQHHCNDGFKGNPYLPKGCKKEDCVGSSCLKSEWKIWLGIGNISFGSLFLLSLAWLLLSTINTRRKEMKRKREFFKRNGGLLLQQHFIPFHDQVDRCKLFSSEDLNKATDHFNENRILGQGGQGTVYKGTLVDGRIIAVKKSKVVDEAKLEEFINEVVILSLINHRNVVKLLGCCLETEVPLLVYEFIPNGTLFQYLHSQSEELQFTWDMRVRIATEVAEALSYLYSAASEPIYHRDIKSTNILLDDKLRAKVADFGTSKSISIDQTHVTTKVQGTFGYLDPEYYHLSKFTDKSDVYSFGVVLVELLTGQKPISSSRSEEYRSLTSYFILAMKEDKLNDILDNEVKLGKEEDVFTIASLAQRCLDTNGKKRPTMKEVALELERIRAQLEGSLQQNFEQDEDVLTGPWTTVTSSTSSTFSNLSPQQTAHHIDITSLSDY